MLGKKQGQIYNHFGSKLLNTPMSFGQKKTHQTHGNNHYEDEKKTEKPLHSDIERRHADQSDNERNPSMKHHHHH